MLIHAKYKEDKNMRVSISNNVLTVVSDIPVAVAERKLTDLTAYDDKKNPLYTVKMGLEGNGSLSQFGFVANTVIDGNLAVMVVEEIGATREDFMRKYGKAVVAAQKYCPIIANAAVTEEEMLEAAFGTVEE